MAQIVTIRLLLDVQNDAEATDWTNETLREMQRDFTPGADLIDYAIDDIEGAELDINANIALDVYQEGDFAR